MINPDQQERQLQADAPPWPSERPIAVCDGCHRKTWNEDSLTEPCGMPQPDGHRCEGTFQPVTNPDQQERWTIALCAEHGRPMVGEPCPICGPESEAADLSVEVMRVTDHEQEVIRLEREVDGWHSSAEHEAKEAKRLKQEVKRLREELNWIAWHAPTGFPWGWFRTWRAARAMKRYARATLEDK